MILAAEAAGLESVGLSVHSPMPFESDWALPQGRLPAYMEEVRRLKKKYAGRMRVYLGIEWDVLSKADLAEFDYVIGSVHHLPEEGFPTVDESEEATGRYLAKLFGGDADAAAAEYFAQLDRVAEEPEADIVGHFDLLTKFDERRHFFDPGSPAFRRAAHTAMERLVKAGKIFEVNTGAISRGYRTTPYPSRQLLDALREMGGRVTVSADAHSAAGIVCAFDQAEALIRACGFREIWELTDDGFAPRAL